jgi:MFS superfamily sulfate permease-like transporter
MSRHPDAGSLPGLLLVRLDAPLYFFNASVAHDEVLGLVRRAEPTPHVVILDIGATSDLDVTTTDSLADLVARLADAGCETWFAQVKGSVRDRMRRTGLMEAVGEDRTYLSVPAAVAAYRPAAQAAGPSPAPSTDEGPG